MLVLFPTSSDVRKHERHTLTKILRSRFKDFEREFKTKAFSGAGRYLGDLGYER